MKKILAVVAVIVIAAKFPNLVEGGVGLSLDAVTTFLTAALKWAGNDNTPQLPASTYQYGSDRPNIPWQAPQQPQQPQQQYGGQP